MQSTRRSAFGGKDAKFLVGFVQGATEVWESKAVEDGLCALRFDTIRVNLVLADSTQVGNNIGGHSSNHCRQVWRYEREN